MTNDVVDDEAQDERIKRTSSTQDLQPSPPTAPTAAQRRTLRAAKQKIASEPPPTELRVGQDQWQRPVIGLPHTDTEGWYAQAKLAFGTVSTAFVEAEIGRLLNALRWRKSTLPLETELNAALAVIEGLRPQNEAEAMMAVQMALTHVAAVEMLSRLGRLDPLSSPEVTTAAGATASKLLRAFAGHVDVFHKLRKPAVQVVRVERVNVEPGAQAVVGAITTARGIAEK